MIIDHAPGVADPSKVLYSLEKFAAYIDKPEALDYYTLWMQERVGILPQNARQAATSLLDVSRHNATNGSLWLMGPVSREIMTERPVMDIVPESCPAPRSGWSFFLPPFRLGALPGEDKDIGSVNSLSWSLVEYESRLSMLVSGWIGTSSSGLSPVWVAQTNTDEDPSMQDREVRHRDPLFMMLGRLFDIVTISGLVANRIETGQQREIWHLV